MGHWIGKPCQRPTAKLMLGSDTKLRKARRKGPWLGSGPGAECTGQANEAHRSVCLSSAGGAGAETVSGRTVGAAADDSDGAWRGSAAVVCAATFVVSGADGGRQRSVSRSFADADAGRTGCRSTAAGVGSDRSPA